MDTTRIEVSVESPTAQMKIGDVSQVSVRFGPHHFLVIYRRDNQVKFAVGATHHGIQADASTVPSELEAFLGNILETYPDAAIDSIPGETFDR